MCCGSRRSAWRAAQASPTRASAPPRRGASPAPASGPAPAAVRSPADAFASVDLRYTGIAAIGVRGPATGRLYDFSGAEPIQTVDVRDAAILTRSESFRRA